MPALYLYALLVPLLANFALYETVTALSPVVPDVNVTFARVAFTFVLEPSMVRVRVPEPEIVAVPVVATVVPAGEEISTTIVSLSTKVDAPM